MREKLRTILCFGDSNTNGCNPNNGERWPYSVRWPGVMQAELGSGYHVIEDGFNGRTTAFEDPFFPYRRGLSALPAILETHYPLDLVIVMLGTNDCKNCYSATPEAIAEGMGRIAEEIIGYRYPEWCDAPDVLLVSPIHMGKEPWKCGCVLFDSSSYEKSLLLAKVFEEKALSIGVHFMDASLFASPGCDNVHMEAEGHMNLGHAMADCVRNIFS